MLIDSDDLSLVDEKGKTITGRTAEFITSKPKN
jgi:hypothetical protein